MCLEAHLRWTGDCNLANWDEFVEYQKKDNKVYTEDGRQFSVRNNESQMYSSIIISVLISVP